MLRLYVNHFLQKRAWLTPLLKYPHYFSWVNSPEDANFLVLECPYEVIYDYTDEEYLYYGIANSEIRLLKDSFEKLKEASSRLNKKIIIFYYRDPSTPLKIPNAIIFRTSINKNSKEKFTFSMPAWIPSKDEKYLLENSSIRTKYTQPFVTFRGQSAALKLPFSTNVRLLGNKLLDMMGFEEKIETYIPPGYIARRNAIKSILRQQNNNRI